MKREIIVVVRHNRSRRFSSLFRGQRLLSPITVGVLIVAIGFTVTPFWGTAPVLAQEGIAEEEPTPTSVEEDISPIERSYIEKPAEPELFPQFKEELKDADPFLRDTKFHVNPRTYYFYRDNYPNSSPQINEAWAIGGAVSYKSGWLLNHFQLGAVYYLSEPLYAPEDRDGTQLLRPGQNATNENEMDLDLQWKPKSGILKNFWPRFRYGVVHQYEGEKNYIHDFRIILNYDFSLL